MRLALFKFQIRTCDGLPAAGTAAIVGHSAIRFLRLPYVPTRLAANRLAEPARLEELLFSRRERETLAAISAGHFFVLGHFITPLEHLC